MYGSRKQSAAFLLKRVAVQNSFDSYYTQKELKVGDLDEEKATIGAGRAEMGACGISCSMPKVGLSYKFDINGVKRKFTADLVQTGDHYSVHCVGRKRCIYSVLFTDWISKQIGHKIKLVKLVLSCSHDPQ